MTLEQLINEIWQRRRDYVRREQMWDWLHKRLHRPSPDSIDKLTESDPVILEVRALGMKGLTSEEMRVQLLEILKRT